MTYIRQFDSIRAFAVILVVVEHWLPKEAYTLFPLGSIGVDIFFVLSGFLITRILLSKKKSIEIDYVNESKVTAIGKFMMRRSLRIFPIYYLMLVVLYIGAPYLPNPIPDDWRYYVLYVQNWLFYSQQSFPGGKVSPFWSLAVEEQFYLFWPWLLFFSPSKYIKPILISGIILGTLCSFLFPLLLAKKALTAVLTPACLQAFCVGGFLSFLAAYRARQLNEYYRYIKFSGITSIGLYVVIKLFFENFMGADRILFALFTAWVLTVILLKKSGRFGGVLDNNILVAIGRVSYGIYVFHNFVPVSFNAVIQYIGKRLEPGLIFNQINFIGNNPILFYSICTLILLFISFSSHYFIEKPFLSLKRYFD
jgi:peptidoglycan/LPS O-acetylase OafA/YrhL